MKPQTFSTSAPGAGWADLTGVARQDALSTWNMPPSRLGAGGGVKYENQRQELASYYKNMVMSRLTLIASALSIVTRQAGYELYFEPSDVPELAEDFAYKLNQAVQGWVNGYLSLDEARVIQGLPPVGGEFGAKYIWEVKEGFAPTPAPANPAPGANEGRDAAPFVRAADPHPLAKKLDAVNEEHIAAFAEFAQSYNTRVYKRVAGAIRRLATRDASDMLPPHLNVQEIFNQQQWDQELQHDVTPYLAAAAGAAVAAVGSHLGSKLPSTVDTAQQVAAQQDVLLNGNEYFAGWNGGISRDLAKAITPKTKEQLTAAAALAAAAATLGVQANDEGDPEYDQETGSRADLISGRAIVGLVGAVAGWLYSQSGTSTQMWQTMEDEKVRDSHAAMDGQTVNAGESFISGLGNQLAYPGDPSGPPEDVANCRCVIVPGS
jgi:hypothetical protein